MAVATVILRVRDEASAPLDDIADAAGEATTRLRRADDALAGTGASASATGSRLDALKGVMGSLNARGGGALAVGMGSVGAALVAVAGAAALAAGSLGAATLIADDALETLEGFERIGSDFYPAVPPETIASIEAANAAVDALASVAAKMAVVIGAAAAPAIEQIAAFTVGLSLATLDLIEVLTAGEGVFRSLTEFLLTGFYKALTFPIVPMQEMVRGMLLLADTLGVKLPAPARAAADALIGMQRDLAGVTVDMVLGASAATGLSDELQRLTERGRAFIGVQQAATAAMDEGTQAAKEAAAATDELADARARLLAESAAAAEGEFQARENPQIQFLTEFYSKLGQARSQTDLQGLLADLAVAMTRYGLSVEQVTAAQEALNAAMGQVPATTPGTSGGGAGSSLDGAGKAQAAIGAAGSIAGLTRLDPSGISAAVVAGLQTAADLGQGGGVLGEVTTLLTDAAEGLPALGDELLSFTDDLLSEIIPSLIEGAAGAVSGVVDRVPDLLQAGMDALPEMIEASLGSLDDLLVGLFRSAFTLVPELLFAAIEVLLDPHFWWDMGMAIVNGVLDALNVFKNEDNTGLLQREGVIGRTGAAIRDIFDGRDNGRIGNTRIEIFNGVIAENLETLQRQRREAERRGVR